MAEFFEGLSLRRPHSLPFPTARITAALCGAEPSSLEAILWPNAQRPSQRSGFVTILNQLGLFVFTLGQHSLWGACVTRDE